MLPSIDKRNQIPNKPASTHVHKIAPTDNVKPRDYAYEMEQVLEREEKPHQHPFGRDTYEHTEDPETSEAQQAAPEPPAETEGEAQDHETDNLDITI